MAAAATSHETKTQVTVGGLHGGAGARRRCGACGESGERDGNW